MRALLLFAEDEVGGIEGWSRLDGSGIVARGARLDTLPAPVEDERIYLLLAGTEVTLRWLELPALTEAQALAAARIEIADDSLGGIDTLHLAIGPIHGSHRVVAAIDDARIAAWIAWGASIGLDPDHIVPLPLLIAYGEGPTRVWTRPGRTLAHGHLEAFAIESTLADALLVDEPREDMDDARFEAELPAALAALAIDLRQGAWRKRRAWRIESASRRRMLRWAIAAAVLLAMIPVARLGRISWDGARLRGEAATVTQQNLGLPEKPADPRRALQQRLERLQGPGMGFVDGAAVLFGAVRQTPNVELAGLHFDETGVIDATVTTTSPADLAELVRRIGSSGLIVEIGGAAGQGGSTIRVRQP